LFYFTAGASINDCHPCVGGSYCNITGLDAPSGLCSAGFYCPDNESISTPTPSSMYPFHCFICCH